MACDALQAEPAAEVEAIAQEVHEDVCIEKGVYRNTATLGLGTAHLRPLTRLWLASRVQPGWEVDSSAFNPAGRPRAFTLANIGIQFSIVRNLWPRVVGVVSRRPSILAHIGVYLVGVVVGGILPAAALWSSGKLLDLVELSLIGHPTTWRVALQYAGMAVTFAVGEQVQALVFRYASTTLQRAVSTSAKRAYISAKLDLAQHASPNPVQRDLVYEAGVLAGVTDYLPWDTNTMIPYGPWDWLNQISYATSAAIDVGTKVYLLVGVLEQDQQGDMMTWSNAMLIALSLAPAAVSVLHNWLWDWYDPYNAHPSPDERRLVMEEQTLQTIIDDEKGRNELVVFSLKDWALKKWDAVQASKRDDETATLAQIGLTAFEAGGEVMAQSVFYVLLATRVIPTNMTLGSIHVHQRLGEALIDSTRMFERCIKNAYQVPFLLAAAFSAADGPESVRVTEDYESLRAPGGMRISTRGLCFGYSEKRVLDNIDIDIPPGESLAVVGFNGSGKTTFIKTLLGLHNHTGSLTINGRDIRDYDPESLHRRMSCLFQDYARYDLTLRDNVGLGDTTRMDNVDLLDTAIDRGGASVIREQLGLDAWLSASRPNLATNYINDEGVSKANSVQDSFVSTGLSGGQWQRIALARAFMRSDTADLIVFDEPSASLDPRAEAELFDRIHSLAHGRGATTIFISHRFNTVRRADRIAFMDQGRIVEYGTHDELMALEGRYFECFDLQRKGYQ